MQNRLAAAVLRQLGGQGEGYFVLDAAEIAKALPGRCKADAGGVGAALLFLEENGYISLRYSSGDTYCAALLPKGRAEACGGVRVRRRGMRLRAALLPFAGAFAGGALAALFAALLF